MFKKVWTGGDWRSQFGGADLQDIELTDELKLIADECATAYGGMDVLAVDLLHEPKKDKIVILELVRRGSGGWMKERKCGGREDECAAER